MATGGLGDERRGGETAGDKLGDISVHVEESFSSVEVMAAAASPIKDGREPHRRSNLLGDSPGRETKVDMSNSRSSTAAAATDSANDSQWHRQRATVSPEGTLDPSDPQIKQDVLAMMVQYLRSEKLFMSAVVIQDEANMKTTEQQTRRAQGKRLRKAALEGDWHLVVSLITKNLSRRHHKRLLYAAYRQEYLELIERQEFQKAFSFLNRRLKPVEAIAASTPNEFLNLCYLLTCKSVADAPHFRTWGGGGSGSRFACPPSEMPPNRLVTLLQQAVAFQIEKGRYHPKVIPQASSLARDYRCPAVPNTPKDTYSGHHTGVKCVTFVGEEAELLASGGADGTIHLWPTNPDHDGGWDWGEGEGIDDGLDSDRSRELAGGGRARQRQQHQQRRRCVAASAEDAADDEGVHREATEGGQGGSGEGDGDAPMRVGGAREGGGDAGGGDDGAGGGEGRTVSPLLSLRCGATCKDKTRVWDVASNRAGNLLASASGDGAVRIWTLPPSEQLLDNAGGGRSTDASPGQQQRPRAVLRGHGAGPGSSAPDVYSVEFHSAQAHVLTAGHDRTVRLYDIESNQEIKVFAGHEAGVLHAIGNSCGNLLVSGGRDSAIIFWDVMSGVCVKTLSQTVGAVTSVDLTMDGMYLLASSRHGPVRTWDVRMGRPLLRYKGHQNTTSSFLRATFGAEEQLVLGGSDDGNLYVWHHRGTQLLHALPGHTGTVYRGTWSANQGLVATCSDDGTVRTWRSRCL